MSIIQEALKKAQNAKPAERAERDGGISAKKPLLRGARRPIGLYVLLLILVALSGVAMKYFSIVPPLVPAAQVTEQVDTFKPREPPPKFESIIQRVQQVIREEPAPKEPALILSGIMHPISGPRALINNMTVAEGEFVEDARVVAISDDRVTLDRKGSEITLRLQ